MQLQRLIFRNGTVILRRTFLPTGSRTADQIFNKHPRYRESQRGRFDLSSSSVISPFNTRCALSVEGCRMIKWREPRDLLYNRKFDWVLAGKIAKFQKNFGECTVRPVLSFPTLSAFYKYLLAPDLFFPSRPIYLSMGEKHFFGGSRSQLRDSALVYFPDAQLLLVAFPSSDRFLWSYASFKALIYEYIYNERTIDQSLIAKFSPITTQQILKSGSQRFYTLAPFNLFCLRKLLSYSKKDF